MKDFVIPARKAPPPSTISPEARQTLVADGPLTEVIFGEPEPDPKDKEAWRRRGEMIESKGAALLEKTADSYPCTAQYHALKNAGYYEITPKSMRPEMSDCVFLFLHPGGYVAGGGVNASYMAMPFADRLGIKTFSLDYRMPPDNPFPAGLHDAVEAYEELLKIYAPKKIIVGGRSAGGGLAAAVILKARDMGLPLPAASILQTPEADLTESGDTFETNLGVDNFLRRLTNSIALYADGHDLRDPYLSPLFGDFNLGFPPTILTSGTRDLFLSNTVLMHRALRRAGIEAELHVWEAMGHGGFFGLAPEDEEVWGELRQFVSRHSACQ